MSFRFLITKMVMLGDFEDLCVISFVRLKKNLGSSQEVGDVSSDFSGATVTSLRSFTLVWGTPRLIIRLSAEFVEVSLVDV